MNTIQDLGPPPPAAPFPATRSRQNTEPVLTQEAVMLRALDATTTAVATAVKQGKIGPWVVALLVALVVVAGGLWAAHMLTGDREIQDRLQALEDAEDDRHTHDQWVVTALQALSENKPLPAYPVPQRRRKAR